MFWEEITSKNIGYRVPIKTTDKKYIMNQLFINIDVSLLSKKNEPELWLSDLWKIKKINKAIKINTNKKVNMNRPLSGSFANVWTEFKIPDRTKKVPHILRVKVEIDKIIVQELREDLFSNTKIQCNKVVKANHGIKETFSTGSQNQNPPQPSS